MAVDHSQVILWFLPGYMFDGHRVVSTGAAVPATQHIDRKTGRLMYYVRPLFDWGPPVGLFISHDGLMKALGRQVGEPTSPDPSSSSDS
jgi:hypothetical protein